MSDLASLLDDVNKLSLFGPVSRRNKIPNFHLVKNEIPSQRKEEHLELPKGFESALNEEDVKVEPDYELISSSVRQVMKPYSFSNAIIEEKLYKKHTQQEKSSRKRNKGKAITSPIPEDVSRNIESDPNKDISSNDLRNIESDPNKDISSNDLRNIESDLNKDISSNGLRNIESDPNKDISSNGWRNIESDPNKDISSDCWRNIKSDPNKNISSNSWRNIESYPNKDISSNSWRNIESDPNKDITSNCWRNIDSDPNKDISSNSWRNIESDPKKDISSNGWRNIEIEPSKISSNLNPDSEEFKLTKKTTRSNENFIVPSETYAAVNSKSQPILNPNSNIAKKLESESTGSFTKIISIETPPQISNVKDKPVNKSKKRLNVAIQSIFQFHNSMEGPNMDETSINKRTVNISGEQPPAIRRPFKPEEMGFSDVTKPNKLYEEGDVEEPFHVKEKCLSWMQSNDAIKSGKASTFKPQHGVEIDMLTLLNMSDDAFAFIPKTKPKKSDTKDIKGMQNASSSSSLVTQQSNETNLRNKTKVNDKLSNSVPASDTTETNNHCFKQIIKDKSESGLDEIYSDNASDVSIASMLSGSILKDDRPYDIEHKELKDSSVDSLEILSDCSSLLAAVIDCGESLNTSSNNTNAAKLAEKELLISSHEEINQYPSMESLAIGSSADKSFSSKNIFNGDGFENGVPKDNKSCTDSVGNSGDKISYGNDIKENASSLLSCSKSNEIISPKPKVIITSKSPCNRTQLSTSSSRDCSPPLCKEELKSPLTLADKNIIYRNLLNLNVSKPEDEEVGEFEKNTIWAAISTKLRNKKKK